MLGDGPTSECPQSRVHQFSGNGRVMDELRPLIKAYRSRASSSVQSRLDALMSMEQIHDRRVVMLLLDVLEDRREGEEVRMYAVQQLRYRGPLVRPALQRKIAHRIGDVLADRSMPELRLQAAVALGDFTHCRGVLTRLNAVCLAQDESIDLRYAAFTSLERAGPTPECVDLLRQMTTDDTLGRSARSVLAAWHLASPASA